VEEREIAEICKKWDSPDKAWGAGRLDRTKRRDSRFQRNAGSQTLPVAAQSTDGSKLIKVRERIRIGTNRGGLPHDMKPRLVLVAHRHVGREDIPQFGFKLVRPDPRDDTSEMEAPLFARVLSL
jgi:hypothetical protein